MSTPSEASYEASTSGRTRPVKESEGDADELCQAIQDAIELLDFAIARNETGGESDARSKTATETITLDRELVERFIVEVDALATFDSIRNGNCASAYTEHIYEIIEPFERAAFGSLRDEDVAALHERGNDRGRELAREVFGPLFTETAPPVIQVLAASLEEAGEDG